MIIQRRRKKKNFQSTIILGRMSAWILFFLMTINLGSKFLDFHLTILDPLVTFFFLFLSAHPND